jgi:hypothetical protein
MKLLNSALFLSLLTFFVLNHAMDSRNTSPSPRKSPVSPETLARVLLQVLDGELSDKALYELNNMLPKEPRLSSPNCSASMVDRLERIFQAAQDQNEQDAIKRLHFHQQPPSDIKKPNAQRN